MSGFAAPALLVAALLAIVAAWAIGTWRRRARKLDHVERERDELERILAHMSDGFALVDPANRVAHMNHRFADLLGAPRSALPGTPFAGFAAAPELEELIARGRAGKPTTSTPIRVATPRERVLHATVTPLPGDPAGVLVVLHDMTEAERLTHMRQDFVANVSHELRTPLTSLRGYAETLLDGALDDAEHRERFVRVIRDQVDRLQAMVEDLLTLAELERATTELDLQPFDLRALAEAQVAAAAALGRGRALERTVEPGPPVPVRADRRRLGQVLANLLDNAIKYTDRGRIAVRLGGTPITAWCEVEDTGPGIPPEAQARVFERFYRVDPARTRERGGTGLGLSIAKHIVELHGGAITLRSEPGRGSTFRFEIPRQ